MRNFNMAHLRTLMVIAQSGSYSSAAKQLFKTQSAISHQISQLEAMVGLPLFEKQGRTNVLTAHGTNLMKYASHILAINDEALRIFTLGETRGTISIGSPHDVAETILPSILKHIHRALPQIKIDVCIDRAPKLMDSLRAGEVDLSISSRFDQDLEGAVLRTSPSAWICASDYVYDARAPVSLVLVDGLSIYRQMALAALEQARIPWTINHIAPNLVGIKAAIRAGFGITPRSIELLGPEMRTLGESEGLPALPDITYYIWVRQNMVNHLARHAYDTLVKNWGLTGIERAN